MFREGGADFWPKESGETSCNSGYWTWALKDGENSAGKSWAAKRVGVCDGCGGLGTDLPGGCVGLWFLHPAVLQQPETFY